MRTTGFWFGVYRVLWHSAEWVLTNRLNCPPTHPLRTQISSYTALEQRVRAARSRGNDA